MFCFMLLFYELIQFWFTSFWFDLNICLCGYVSGEVQFVSVFLMENNLSANILTCCHDRFSQTCFLVFLLKCFSVLIVPVFSYFLGLVPVSFAYLFIPLRPGIQCTISAKFLLIPTLTVRVNRMWCQAKAQDLCAHYTVCLSSCNMTAHTIHAK